MKKIKRFIPLTSDSAFKILFSEYDEFVKYFLETILETDVNDIKFLDREQVKEKINEHRMTLDLLLLINEIKYSCKSLVSWYSSIIISFKEFLISNLTLGLHSIIFIDIFIISLNSKKLFFCFNVFNALSISLTISNIVVHNH